MKYVFPINEFYLEDRLFDYRLIIYLLKNSHQTKGEKHKYILKEKINIKKISAEMNSSRNTIRKKINHLLDIGYLKTHINSEGSEYYLIQNYFEDGYILLEESIVDVLYISNYILIKTYLVYKKFCAIGLSKSCYLSKPSILSKIGYSTKSNKNLELLSKVNNELSNLKLIEVEKLVEFEPKSNKFKLHNRIRILK